MSRAQKVLMAIECANLSAVETMEAQMRFAVLEFIEKEELGQIRQSLEQTIQRGMESKSYRKWAKKNPVEAA